MKKLVLGAVLGLASLAITASGASAQTLEAIQKRGKVLIAIDTGTPPYGSLDANMQPAGADVDVANLIAKDLGVPLEIVPVTGPNRVAYLLTNKADLVVATFSVTAERAKSVAFTIPYGSNAVVVAGRSKIEARDVAALSGKSIAVVRGTIQDTDLTRIAPKDANVRRYEDDATAATAILSGQVDFIVTGQQIAKAIIDKDPSKSLEEKFTIRVSPYSIGLRRGDADFLQLVNTFIYTHRLNGDLEAVHQKWIGGKPSPLPSF